MKPGDDRMTPQWLFDELDKRFGFTLDACATEQSAKCKKFFTEKQNGLEMDWSSERVWVNPPFSEIWPWVVAAWNSNADLVAMIVPANRTEQPWWQAHVEPFRDGGFSMPTKERWALRTVFLPKRIQFDRPDGKKDSRPKFGCVLLVWERRK